MNTQKLSLFALVCGLCLCLPLGLYAQQIDITPLQTDAVIIKYSRSANATFVDLGRDMLHRYKMDYCRTLQLKPSKQAPMQYADIESALNADRVRAYVIKEIIDGGRLVSGYYRFSGDRADKQRYILYAYDSAGNIALISIGGGLESEKLVNKLQKRTNTSGNQSEE